MSQPKSTEEGPSLDSVFRNYDSQQAAAYASHRGSYSNGLYGILLDQFESRGGRFNTLLDVGCGTGEVTRTLGKYFEHAVGVDHSQEMISRACQEGGLTKVGNGIQYEVGNAEEVGKLHAIEPASVDLLTVGMAVSPSYKTPLLSTSGRSQFNVQMFR
jgi:ubiquinone/menaquinone biosynthesis C-methylase UbiE